jgi:hypothetical protein
LEFPVGRKEGEEGWKEEVTIVKSRDHLAGGKKSFKHIPTGSFTVMIGIRTMVFYSFFLKPIH